MMSGHEITETGSRSSHMRSKISAERNHNNTVSKLSLNQILLFVLFYRSNTNMREFIVIYVLN